MAQASAYQEYRFDDAAPLCSAPWLVPAVLRTIASPSEQPRVLDVGCGNGALAGELLSRGYDITGVDLSEEGIAIARDAHPSGRFEVLPAQADFLAELDTPAFDLIVSTEVIEHLYDPISFLDSCFAALAPGGQLVLSTPYHGYLKNIAIAATGKFDFHMHPDRVGGHIKFWSRRTLTQALGATGFERVRSTGAGRIPWLWKCMVCTGYRPLPGSSSG